MNALTGTPEPYRVANSAFLEWVVRLGLVAYGVVHLLVAWLVLQIALGGVRAT